MTQRLSASLPNKESRVFYPSGTSAKQSEQCFYLSGTSAVFRGIMSSSLGTVKPAGGRIQGSCKLGRFSGFLDLFMNRG